ncbi:MAG: esterase-like activity of phytase family protein [Pseudomonas sp.]
MTATLASLLFSGALCAAEAPIAVPAELKLLAEYPIDGMPSGNLSGLTRCGNEWQAVSDHDDNRLYRLQPQDNVWAAEAEHFDAPPPPASGLPWGLRMRTWAANILRGADLDFEGLSCDSLGNRYLASEAHAAVLQITAGGQAEWLNLPANLVRQARASGMLLHYNAQLEGISVAPDGKRLWLAAERERRGLLVLHKPNSSWSCSGGCVLLSQAGKEPSVAEPDSGITLPRDFSDVHFFKEKLFTLERAAHRICRRDLNAGKVEKCWSFATEALADGRRYSGPFGVAEALWLDADGAWLGVDNGDAHRDDGEERPLIWHFAAPKGGWSAP